MNPFKRTLLCSALAGLGVGAMIDACHAVNVSADGRGQVLLYPYYTTRADSTGSTYGTLLSVVNATGSAKGVRVRFLEGKNSREVIDFNLFLSPYDVWTAAVLPDAGTGGARIGTVDVSCTLPPFSTSPTSPFVSFVNFFYTGANDDGGGSSLDRTKEGYFEIIEMAAYAPSSTTGKAITHVPRMVAPYSVPPCGADLNNSQAALDAQPPTGGLFGGITLINVGSGTDYTADAVALANFSVLPLYQPSLSALPDLTQASPPISAIQTPDGRLYESTWNPATADAVSAVLMHDSLMNEYVLDLATRSGTDWVVTMPTKKFYVNVGTGNASRLFQRNFEGNVGSCDTVTLDLFDREERRVAIAPPTLCWEANVLTFNNSNVLGSSNVASLNTFFENGWLSIGFPTAIPSAAADVHMLVNQGATTISGRGVPTSTGNTSTYVGLPAIGFAVVSYMNGTLQVGSPPVTVLSNYGGNFVHKTGTTIQ